MQVDSRAGRFLRGAEDGTSRALSCKRPSMAKAALPHASTKLDRTSRRELSLQAAANGSKASSSVMIAPQNWGETEGKDTMISITEGKSVSKRKNRKKKKKNQTETSLDINNGTFASHQNEKTEHVSITHAFFSNIVGAEKQTSVQM